MVDPVPECISDAGVIISIQLHSSVPGPHLRSGAMSGPTDTMLERPELWLLRGEDAEWDGRNCVWVAVEMGNTK